MHTRSALRISRSNFLSFSERTSGKLYCANAQHHSAANRGIYLGRLDFLQSEANLSQVWVS